MRRCRTHILVAVMVSAFWLLLLFKPSIGSYPGFTGLTVSYRWGSGGPMLQVGHFSGCGNLCGVAYWRPGGLVPWAICVDDRRLWLQEGQ